MKKGITELKLIPIAALLVAMCMSVFVAQAQDKQTIVKKQIIVKKIDENGNVLTETIEGIEDIDLPNIDHLIGKAHHLNFGPGFNNKEKKVIVLDDNEDIPQEIQKELTEMGLNMVDINQQLQAAKEGIIIRKSVGKNATVEEYEQDIIHRIQSNSINGLEEMNIDIDIDEPGHNIFRIDKNGETNTFQFDGNQIPDDVLQKLKEYGIDLKMLENGGSWIEKDNGLFDLQGQNFEFRSEDGKQKRKMMIITDENELSDEIKNQLKNSGIDLNQLKNCDKGSSSFKGFQTAKVKPFFGVMVSDHDKGAEIDKVVDNSAASEAGFKKGDVITQLNDQKIGSYIDLIRYVKAQKPGDKIKVKFIRDGKNKKKNVVLQSKEVKSRGNARQFQSYGKSGCDNLKQLRSQDFRGGQHWGSMNHKYEDCEKLCTTPMLGVMISTADGAKVTKVFSNTGAEAAGLKLGDVITGIDKTQVESMNDLIAAVKQYKPGNKVTLELVRDGKTEKVKATISNKAATRKNSTCDCNQKDFKKEVDKEIIILKQGKTSLFLEEPAPTAPKPSPKIRIGQKNTLDVSAVALYPNPNDGEFTVDFALEETTPVTITVLDLAGREVYKMVLSDFNGNHRQKINISDYAPGSYFFNIVQGDKVYTKKFIFNR